VRDGARRVPGLPPGGGVGLTGARHGVLGKAYPVPNVAEEAPGRCGFLIDARAQLRTMREIEDSGLALGAIYHSHPHAPAIPSEGDIRLAAYPEALHLIVGLRDPASPEVRAWRITDGRPGELALRIIPGPPKPPA
jgi:proteasome lid subunit RPN8/RPN11